MGKGEKHAYFVIQAKFRIPTEIGDKRHVAAVCIGAFQMQIVHQNDAVILERRNE